MRKCTGYGFLIKWLIVLGDVLVLNLVFFLVYYFGGFGLPVELLSKFKIVIFLLNLCYFFSLYFFPVRIYLPIMYTDKVVQKSLYILSLHGCIFISSLFFLGLDIFPLNFFAYYYFFLLFSFTMWRIFARESLKSYRSVGRNFKKVIIVGAGKNGMDLYAEMAKDSSYGYRVLGFFDDNVLLKNTLPNYLGMTHELEQFISSNEVDDIYCTLPNSQDEKILRILNFAEKNMLRFYLVPEFHRYVKKSLTLENIETLPVMALRTEPLQNIYNRMLKRSFDIIFSFCFLISVYPILYIVSALFIKLSSPGPIIFKQLRTGIYGRDFYCQKFRSMHVNDHADHKQAQKNDPRNTRIGNFLRKTNLDEIPQFYNVLKGDMSVVGPRPHMLKHTQMYSIAIDKYMVRHLVKPGITGWAQVNGYRGETKSMQQMEGRVRYDVWYIENWSFLLDLKIVVVTIISMFKGDKNAY